jgi:hypothetical protein
LDSISGALAFAQDMVLSRLLIADWQAIAHTCEHNVNENSQCANRKQRQHDYAPRQKVLKKVHDPTRLGVRMEGPYTIDTECVNVNVYITIILREGVTEGINIRAAVLLTLFCMPL